MTLEARYVFRFEIYAQAMYDILHEILLSFREDKKMFVSYGENRTHDLL